MATQISKADFRDAMARVCAPVNIVTTDGPAGRGGFTATAMCSVSDEPPTLLVCMNGRSTQAAMFLANRRFCVNVLTHDHMHLAGKFAGATRDMEARYSAARWQTLTSGTPALSDDCEIEDVHVVGTHNVMIGRVIDVRHGSGGSALLYVDRNYTQPTRLGSFGGEQPLSRRMHHWPKPSQLRHPWAEQPRSGVAETLGSMPRPWSRVQRRRILHGSGVRKSRHGS